MGAAVRWQREFACVVTLLRASSLGWTARVGWTPRWDGQLEWAGPVLQGCSEEGIAGETLLAGSGCCARVARRGSRLLSMQFAGRDEFHVLATQARVRSLQKAARWDRRFGSGVISTQNRFPKCCVKSRWLKTVGGWQRETAEQGMATGSCWGDLFRYRKTAAPPVRLFRYRKTRYRRAHGLHSLSSMTLYVVPLQIVLVVLSLCIETAHET